MGDKVKMQELDPSTQEQLQGLFKGHSHLARFGDAGYLMSATYKEDAEAFRNMAVRADDVWITTFPRSGTTMTQELIWLLKTDFDYENAAKILLLDRFIYLGIKQVGNPELVKFVSERMLSNEELDDAPSPRFIKTHVPLSLLPAGLLDTTRLVYVARDPRDVAVSFYHALRLIKSYVGDFKTFWYLFTNDLVTYSPFFQHVKEAWALRNHPNMLFLFYEDVTKDLPSNIQRLADFLGKEVTPSDIEKLCEHMDINKFRKNQSINPTWLIQSIADPDAEGFVRKGKAGGWREWFDAEMSAQAQEWMRAHLAGTDLRFPDTE